MVDDYIDPVPTSYDGKSPAVAVNLKTLAGQRIEVDPFPFDVNPLRVQLIRRRMPQKSFADPAAFRTAYFQTVPEAVDFVLCAR